MERMDEILKNIWIRENKAATELIKKVRDDERRHTEALRKLTTRRFSGGTPMT
jgi:rubrerythrin